MFTYRNLIIASVALYLIIYVLKDDIHKILVGILAAWIILNWTEGFTDENGFRFSGEKKANKIKDNAIIL